MRLFYSYSRKDEKLRLKLWEHLAVLRWSDLISEWGFRDIDAGQDWEKEISHKLCSADIILLLVSSSFLASKYCWSVEMKKALERQGRGEATVIPVILRPCRWERAPFAKLQAVPKDGLAVTTWTDPEATFADVVGNINWWWRNCRSSVKRRRSLQRRAEGRRKRGVKPRRSRSQ